jgi:hypothetical protein
MKRIQVSEDFFLDEFIDPVIYGQWGERSIQFIDHRIILAAQFVREKTGRSVTINNWATKGRFKESGLRRFDTRTGASMSQHKFGRAIDIKVSGMTPREVFAIVKAHEDYLIENQIITTIESLSMTPTWLHLDCRFTGLDRFLIVEP